MNKQQQQDLRTVLDFFCARTTNFGTGEKAIEIGDAVTRLYAALDNNQLEALRPDWSQAPDWAMWWAVDANGRTNWYEVEPRRIGELWSVARSDKWTAGGDVDLPLGIDWRQTLQRRPEADHGA